MRISIVIATFNRAALLATTLEHLRRQDYEPGDEVIVVDNASTDSTPEVIAGAAAGFPARFEAIRETAPGKTPALNRGIAAATGDVLALTDDDVMVADDWVGTIRGIFGVEAVDLIGGRVEPRWERPAPAWLRVEEGGRYGPLASPLALLHYGDAQDLGARTAVGANLAVRHDVLKALGGFAAHLGRRAGTLLCGEDHDLCQRAVRSGYRCEYRPEVRVRHWVPAARMTLRYYVRWFFWSGVTDAMLEQGTSAGDRLVPPYLVRRVLRAPVAALRHLVAGRSADAAQSITEAAHALGNLLERLRSRLWRARTSPAVSEAHRAGAAPGGFPRTAHLPAPTAANSTGMESR